MTPRSPLVTLAGVSRAHRGGQVLALHGVSLDIAAGEYVAITGPSGCGKTTLLHVICGIDEPTAGSVAFEGSVLSRRREWTQARARRIGVVYQAFNLFPTLTALENVMLPMDFLRRGSVAERRERARERLELVGLGDKVDNLPSELSGGQQQRVAIARALVNEPKVLIGDEPTGNLDSKTEAAMFELFAELNRQGTTVIYVTHSPALAAKARVRVEMVDGQLVQA